MAWPALHKYGKGEKLWHHHADRPLVVQIGTTTPEEDVYTKKLPGVVGFIDAVSKSLLEHPHIDGTKEQLPDAGCLDGNDAERYGPA